MVKTNYGSMTLACDKNLHTEKAPFKIRHSFGETCILTLLFLALKLNVMRNIIIVYKI